MPGVSGLLDEVMPDASSPPPMIVEGAPVYAVCRLLDSHWPGGGLQYLGRGVEYQRRMFQQTCLLLLDELLRQHERSSSDLSPLGKWNMTVHRNKWHLMKMWRSWMRITEVLGSWRRCSV
ncbi:hypothetical protein AOLI_G00210170 [Acnodon oligacanthus]